MHRNPASRLAATAAPAALLHAHSAAALQSAWSAATCRVRCAKKRRISAPRLLPCYARRCGANGAALSAALEALAGAERAAYGALLAPTRCHKAPPRAHAVQRQKCALSSLDSARHTRPPSQRVSGRSSRAPQHKPASLASSTSSAPDIAPAWPSFPCAPPRMASAALAARSSWAWPAAEAPKAAQRTKLAATYEALLAGTAVAGHAACAPRDVLRDDWAPPRFWDEMLLLKARACCCCSASAPPPSALHARTRLPKPFRGTPTLLVLTPARAS